MDFQLQALPSLSSLLQPLELGLSPVMGVGADEETTGMSIKAVPLLDKSSSSPGLVLNIMPPLFLQGGSEVALYLTRIIPFVLKFLLGSFFISPRQLKQFYLAPVLS